MRTERVAFDGGLGHELAGQLDRPDGEPRAYALFAHCFTCTRNYKAMSHVGRALVDAGIAVLRFDFTGLGQSEGAFEETTFSSNVDDLLSAVEFLRTRYAPPALLLGHSLGGAAVLRAAASVPSCRAVATIAAPSEPSHLAGLFEGKLEELDRSGVATVRVAGRQFRLRREFLEDLYAHPLLDELPQLGRALLVLHAPADRVVPLEHAAALFQAARHPKSFVSLADADHLLSRAEDGEYVGALVATWAQRYLGEVGGRG